MTNPAPAEQNPVPTPVACGLERRRPVRGPAFESLFARLLRARRHSVAPHSNLAVAWCQALRSGGLRASIEAGPFPSRRPWVTALALRAYHGVQGAPDQPAARCPPTLRGSPDAARHLSPAPPRAALRSGGPARRDRCAGPRAAAPGGAARAPASCGRWRTGSASSRSTRSTCSPAPTTSRGSAAWARTTPRDLDRLSHRAPRRLFEYWGHEASLLPVRLQPHLRWRMDRAAHEAWGGMRAMHRERPRAARPGARGRPRPRPGLRARPRGRERPRRSGPWWDWSDVKRAVEFLFWSGEVTSARRRGFERLYDLPERVLPRAVFQRPDAAGRRGPARARARRRTRVRGGDRARPARLLPPARRRGP